MYQKDEIIEIMTQILANRIAGGGFHTHFIPQSLQYAKDAIDLIEGDPEIE